MRKTVIRINEKFPKLLTMTQSSMNVQMFNLSNFRGCIILIKNWFSQKAIEWKFSYAVVKWKFVALRYPLNTNERLSNATMSNIDYLLLITWQNYCSSGKVLCLLIVDLIEKRNKGNFFHLSTKNTRTLNDRRKNFSSLDWMKMRKIFVLFVFRDHKRLLLSHPIFFSEENVTI